MKVISTNDSQLLMHLKVSNQHLHCATLMVILCMLHYEDKIKFLEAHLDMDIKNLGMTLDKSKC